MGRLKAQTTSTKTPVLASTTQGETASGVCPTNVRISAGSAVCSQPSENIYVNFMKVRFLFSKYARTRTNTNPYDTKANAAG